MKNHEEFRATVFEKAKQYEIRRKTRNKKIIETVSLCSLCAVIGISVHLSGTNQTTSDEGICHTAVNNSISYVSSTSSFEHTNVELSEEKADNTDIISETTSLSVWTTTDGEETTAPDASTSQMQEETMTYTTILPRYIVSNLEYTNELQPQAFLLQTENHLQTFLFDQESLFFDSDILMMKTMFDSDFFEENILVFAIVPKTWTAYHLTYPSGVLRSDFQNIETESIRIGYELHTYAVPRSKSEPCYLLTYDSDEETP